MSIYEKTLNEYLEAAASKSHTPGGGSVSAVVGANAASMVSMVANLTIGKKKYAEVQEEIQAILTDATSAIEDLKRLTAADMDAFDRVMEAWRMPSDTEEEKAAKEAAIEPATKNATEVPMEISRTCLEILRLAVRLAPIGNKSAISDVGVGAYVAEAALRSAMLSVDINLPSLKDETFREEIEAERAALLSEAENLRLIAVTDVQKRM